MMFNPYTLTTFVFFIATLGLGHANDDFTDVLFHGFNSPGGALPLPAGALPTNTADAAAQGWSYAGYRKSGLGFAWSLDGASDVSFCFVLPETQCERNVA